MPKKNIWALDMGAWSLKVARGRREKNGSIFVDLYDEINYGALGAEKKGGALSGVQEAVNEFSRRHAPTASDELCVALSGSEVFSRFINLPPVPDSIDDIIQYEARQQIPFDMDQVVWDYQPVKDEHESWEEVKVGLFALKNDTIEELMDILSPWKKNIRLIQQAPLAAYNFLSFEGYDSEPAVMVDMGGSSTGIVVIDPPEFWLRSLRVGGDALTERIESHFGVSKKEAERIKVRAGQKGKQAQLLRVVGKPVGNALSEIQRSLGYYKSLVPDVKFNKIIGVGNTFRLKGMDRVLAEGLQAEVQVLDSVKNISLTREAKNAVGSGLCGCCALFGLISQRLGEGRIKVNLVPEEVARENTMRKKKPLLAGAALGLLLAAVVLIMGEMLYGGRVESEFDTGEALARRQSELNREYSQIQSEIDDLESEARKLAGRAVPRDFYLHFLPALSRIVTEGETYRPGELLPEAFYIREFKTYWISTGDYERYAEDPEGFEVGVEERRDRYDMPPDEEMYRDMPDMGPDGPGQRDRGPQAIELAGWGSMAGRDSVLVVEAVCESTVTRRGVTRYLENVIETLRESRYGETGKPVFIDVRNVGTPRRIRRRRDEDTAVDPRDQRDGRQQTTRRDDRRRQYDDMPPEYYDGRPREEEDDEDVFEFIEFRILAAVNLPGEDVEEELE